MKIPIMWTPDYNGCRWGREGKRREGKRREGKTLRGNGLKGNGMEPKRRGGM